MTNEASSTLPPIAPAPTSAPGYVPSSSSGLVALGLFALATICGLALWRFWPAIESDVAQSAAAVSPLSTGRTGVAANFVVVDLGRIVAARFVAVANNKAVSAQQIASDNEVFASELRTRLSDLASTGAIVLDARQLMAFPKATDQTEWLAAQLKIDLSPVAATNVSASSSAALPTAAPVTSAPPVAVPGAIAVSPADVQKRNERTDND